MGKKKSAQASKTAALSPVSEKSSTVVNTSIPSSPKANSLGNNNSNHNSHSERNSGQALPHNDLQTLTAPKAQQFEHILNAPGLIKINRGTVQSDLATINPASQSLISQQLPALFQQLDIIFEPNGFLRFLADNMQANLTALCGGAALNILNDIAYSDIDYIVQLPHINDQTVQRISNLVTYFFANHPVFLNKQQDYLQFLGYQTHFEFNHRYKPYIKHIKLESGGEFIVCRFGSPTYANSGLDIKFVTSFKGMGLFEIEKLAIDIKTRKILYLGEYNTDAEHQEKLQTALVQLYDRACIPVPDQNNAEEEFKGEHMLFRSILRITQGFTIPRTYYATIMTPAHTPVANNVNPHADNNNNNNNLNNPALIKKRTFLDEIKGFVLNHYLQHNVFRHEYAFAFFVNIFSVIIEQKKEGDAAVLHDLYSYFMYSFIREISQLTLKDSRLNHVIKFFLHYQTPENSNPYDCIIDFNLLPDALKFLKGILLLLDITENHNLAITDHLALHTTRAEHCFITIENPVQDIWDIIPAWRKLNAHLQTKKQQHQEQKNWRWEKFIEETFGFCQNNDVSVSDFIEEKVLQVINQYIIFSSKDKKKTAALKSIILFAMTDDILIKNKNTKANIYQSATKFLNSAEESAWDEALIAIGKWVVRNYFETEENRIKKVKTFFPHCPAQDKTRLFIEAALEHFNANPNYHDKPLKNFILEFGKNEIMRSHRITEIETLLKNFISHDIAQIIEQTHDNQNPARLAIAALPSEVPPAMLINLSLHLLSAFGTLCMKNSATAIAMLENITVFNKVLSALKQPKQALYDTIIATLEFVTRNAFIILKEREHLSTFISCLDNLSQTYDEVEFEKYCSVLAKLSDIFHAFYAFGCKRDFNNLLQNTGAIKKPSFWMILKNFPNLYQQTFKTLLSAPILSQNDTLHILEVVSQPEILNDNFIFVTLLSRIYDIVKVSGKDNKMLDKILSKMIADEQQIYLLPIEKIENIYAAITLYLKFVSKAQLSTPANKTLAKIAAICQLLAQPAPDKLLKLSDHLPMSDQIPLLFSLLDNRINANIFSTRENNFVKTLVAQISVEKNKKPDKKSDQNPNARLYELPQITKVITFYLDYIIKESYRSTAILPSFLGPVFDLMPQKEVQKLGIKIYQHMRSLILQHPASALMLLQSILYYDAESMSFHTTRSTEYIDLMRKAIAEIIDYAPTFISDEKNKDFKNIYLSVIKAFLLKDFVFIIPHPHIISRIKIIFDLVSQQNSIDDIVDLLKTIHCNLMMQPIFDESMNEMLEFILPFISNAIQQHIGSDRLIDQLVTIMHYSHVFSEQNGRLITCILQAAKRYHDNLPLITGTSRKEKKGADTYVEFNVLISSTVKKLTLTRNSFVSTLDAYDFIRAACDMFFGENTNQYKQLPFFNQLLDAILIAQEILLSRYREYSENEKKICTDVSTDIRSVFDMLLNLYAFYKQKIGDNIAPILSSCFIKISIFVTHYANIIPRSKDLYKIFYQTYEIIQKLQGKDRIVVATFEDLILKHLSLDTMSLKDPTFFDTTDIDFTENFIEFINMLLGSCASLKANSDKKSIKLQTVAKFLIHNHHAILEFLASLKKEHKVFEAITNTFFTLKASVASLFSLHEFEELFKLYEATITLFSQANPYLPKNYLAIYQDAFESIFFSNEGKQYIQQCRDEAQYMTMLNTMMTYIKYLFDAPITTISAQADLLRALKMMTTGAQNNARLHCDLFIYFCKKGTQFCLEDQQTVNPLIIYLYSDITSTMIKNIKVNELEDAHVKHIFYLAWQLIATSTIDSHETRRNFYNAFVIIESLANRFSAMPLCKSELFTAIVDACITMNETNTEEMSGNEKRTFFDNTAKLLANMQAQQLISYGNQYKLDAKIESLKVVQTVMEIELQETGKSSLTQ